MRFICGQVGRFKPEHERALDAFASNAGEDALRHTLLVFTHCDVDNLDAILSPDERQNH